MKKNNTFQQIHQHHHNTQVYYQHISNRHNVMYICHLSKYLKINKFTKKKKKNNKKHALYYHNVQEKHIVSNQ